MWRAISAVVVMSALTASADTELGAPLPEGSRKVAEHRYKSSTDFEGTTKFYKKVFNDFSSAKKKIVNQPGVNAIHYPNTSGRGAWEGLNIYEANDEVRIFVVPAKESGNKKPKK